MAVRPGGGPHQRAGAGRAACGRPGTAAGFRGCARGANYYLLGELLGAAPRPADVWRCRLPGRGQLLPRPCPRRRPAPFLAVVFTERESEARRGRDATAEGTRGKMMKMSGRELAAAPLPAVPAGAGSEGRAGSRVTAPPGNAKCSPGGQRSARVAEDCPGGAECEEGGQPWGSARWPPSQPGPPVRCRLLHAA